MRAKAEEEVAALTAGDYPTVPIVHATDVGLIGDGVTDNTEVFRSLMSVGNRTVWIEAGDYITSRFFIPANTRLVLEPGTTIRDSGQLGPQERLINIREENIVIIGAGARVIANRDDYATGEQRHGVHIFGARNVVIDGLESSGHGGDGFYIGGPLGQPATDITLSGCRADNNRRQGLSITSARRVRVADCEFMNTNGTAPEFGIDLEPNRPSDALSEIVLLRPQTIRNRGGGIMIQLNRLDASSEPVHIVIIDHFSDGERSPLHAQDLPPSPAAVFYNRAL